MRFPFKEKDCKYKHRTLRLKLLPCNSEILATAFRFGQSSWIQNAYFLRKLFTTRFLDEVRRKYAVWSSRCSKVAPKSNFIEFGSAHEWSDTNLKMVNFSSIDSTGSGKGSYVFQRRGKTTKKKNVDWHGVELSSSDIVLAYSEARQSLAPTEQR